MNVPNESPTARYASHRETYLRDGFAIVRGVVPPDEVEALGAVADELVELARSNPRDPFSHTYLPHRPDQGALYDLYQRVPEFAALARRPSVVDALATIYAPNFMLYTNSLVYKPPGANNEVPWHQDFMNRRDEPLKAIAWIPLDRVTEENGCLYVVPGSHRRGFLPSYEAEGETHHTRLVTDGIDLSSAVPVLLEAGDMLIFNQLVLHSSRRVDAVTPRRAYRLAVQSFESTDVPRGGPIVLSLRDRAALARHTPEPPAPTIGSLARDAVRAVRARIGR